MRVHVKSTDPSMKSATKWVIWAICICILGASALYAGKIMLTPVEAASKVLDADNMIYNYEWFFKQHQDFLSMKEKIEIMQDDGADKEPQQKIVLQGLKMQLMDIKAKYNARADMATRNFLKADKLPEQL